MGRIIDSVRAVRIFVSDLERARRFDGGALELPERDGGAGVAIFPRDPDGYVPTLVG